MNEMPALLAPAGSLRPFLTALRFGADAVYCGAKQYGLRAQADNFDGQALADMTALAHASGVGACLPVRGVGHPDALQHGSCTVKRLLL